MIDRRLRSNHLRTIVTVLIITLNTGAEFRYSYDFDGGSLPTPPPCPSTRGGGHVSAHTV